MRAARVLSSMFGIGYLPKAPGTAGAILGLVFGAVLLHVAAIPGLLIGVVIVSLSGLWAVSHTGHASLDPGWIIIDEVAGQMIALLGLDRMSWHGLLLAFLLFRLFDIRKPWPVRIANARPDELGIMADDWLAGALAAAVIMAARSIWPGLGM